MDRDQLAYQITRLSKQKAEKMKALDDLCNSLDKDEIYKAADLEITRLLKNDDLLTNKYVKEIHFTQSVTEIKENIRKEMCQCRNELSEINSQLKTAVLSYVKTDTPENQPIRYVLQFV